MPKKQVDSNADAKSSEHSEDYYRNDFTIETTFWGAVRGEEGQNTELDDWFHEEIESAMEYIQKKAG